MSNEIRENHARTGSSRTRQVGIAILVVACLVSVLPVLATSARGAGGVFVVAPGGLATGDGSIAKPLSIEKAFGTSSPVRPGDQILLRGGTYTGTYWSMVSGTPDAPIVVRSYPGEWAVFDSGTAMKPSISVNGSDTWFRDFEVTKSDPKRISSQSGAAPSDISRGYSGGTNGDGIFVFGPRTKLINLVVHDTGDAIGLWDRGTQTEVYGCILYNNGFLSTDHAWGHGIYAHNPDGGGTKVVADTLMFNNWGFGMTAYAPNDNITDLVVEGVTSFDNGTPVSDPMPNIQVGPGNGTLDRIVARNNVTYHRAPKGEGMRLGFASDGQLKQNGTVTVENNAVLGGRFGMTLQGWKTATVRNNAFSAPIADPGSYELMRVFTNAIDGASIQVPSGTYNVSQNSYVDPNATYAAYTRSFTRYTKTTTGTWSGGRLNYQNWVQSTGYDSSSAFSTSASSAPRVIVRPNRYEAGRAYVTVINPARTPGVALDPASAGIKVGQRYEIRDVQNLTGAPVVTGTFDGQPVTVRMDSTDAMQPIGGSPNPVRHTPVDFGVFQVRAAS